MEVCVNNAWGLVCDRYWDEADGNVVCRQLGYQPSGELYILLQAGAYYTFHFCECI